MNRVRYWMAVVAFVSVPMAAIAVLVVVLALFGVKLG